MVSTSDTMVIHEVTHPYILPAVLVIFFGVLFLYNVYGLISRYKRMKRLSRAEGMIIRGHKKLVANHEELFVEGIGALDGSFMENQIAGNQAELMSINAGEYKKREEKARLRAKKREEERSRKRRKAEQKQARKKKKLTPQQKYLKAQKDVKRYDACYELFAFDAKKKIKQVRAELENVPPEKQRYIDFLTMKYGNKVEKKETEERLRAEEQKRKKEERRKQKKALADARKNADEDLFSKN